jgi:hypothetical protein
MAGSSETGGPQGAGSAQGPAPIVGTGAAPLVHRPASGPMTLDHLQKLALAELALRGPKGFVGSGGPIVTTRDAQARPFVEVALLYGQAVGGTRPVELALTRLQEMARDHQCDAVVAVELLDYEVKVGTVIVAYGTGIRYIDV